METRDRVYVNAENNVEVTNLKKLIIAVPSLDKISDNINTLLRNYYANTIFRTEPQFDKYIELGKDLLGLLDHCNVIYSITCSCGTKYVGHTRRLFKIKIKEEKEISDKAKIP